MKRSLLVGCFHMFKKLIRSGLLNQQLFVSIFNTEISDEILLAIRITFYFYKKQNTRKCWTKKCVLAYYLISVGIMFTNSIYIELSNGVWLTQETWQTMKHRQQKFHGFPVVLKRPRSFAKVVKNKLWGAEVGEFELRNI